MQKSTVVIDANVILRYFLRDNEALFRKADQFFTEILSGKKKALVIQSVIAEVVYVLQKVYGVKRREIADVLSDFIKMKGVSVSDKEAVLSALEIYANENLDFVDCMICAYGKNYEVLTFDKKISRFLKKKRKQS